MAKISVLKTGILLFIIGGLINTVLMKNNIVGIPRDLIRLITLIGLMLIPVGVVQKIIAKKRQ
ncbi:MAG: hypothetical protein WC592_07130 [Candidatus Omnitrophota bacterium]